MTSMFLLLYISVWVLSMAVIFIVCRWVFAVDKKLRNQRTQIELLAVIASKLGVDNTDIAKIVYPDRK